MIIKIREYVSIIKNQFRYSEFWACSNPDLCFRVDVLKSPFLKGDLGGFSSASEIPPTPFSKGGIKGGFSPLFQKGAQEKMGYDFHFSHRVRLHVSKISFVKGFRRQ